MQWILFEVPIKMLYFLLLDWFELNNWFVWRMRSPLHSEEKNNKPNMVLALGWWSPVSFMLVIQLRPMQSRKIQFFFNLQLPGIIEFYIFDDRIVLLVLELP